MKINYLVLCITLLLAHHSSYTRLIELRHETDLQQAIATNKAGLVVKFTADWCSACKKVAQPFKQIMEEPEFSSITAINIDVDAFPDIAQKYNIEGIPTFYYFAPGGAFLESTVGVPDSANINQTFRAELRAKFLQHTVLSPTKMTQPITQEKAVPAAQELVPTATSIKISQPVQKAAVLGKNTQPSALIQHDKPLKTEHPQGFFAWLSGLVTMIFSWIRGFFEGIFTLFKKLL